MEAHDSLQCGRGSVREAREQGKQGTEDLLQLAAQRQISLLRPGAGPAGTPHLWPCKSAQGQLLRSTSHDLQMQAAA